MTEVNVRSILCTEPVTCFFIVFYIINHYTFFFVIIELSYVTQCILICFYTVKDSFMLKTLFLSSVAVATLSLSPVHAMNPNKDFVPLFPTANRSSTSSTSTSSTSSTSASSTSTSSTSSTSSRVLVAVPMPDRDIMDEITEPEPVSGPMGPIRIRDANGVVRFVAP